jgi:hypothetical protein
MQEIDDCRKKVSVIGRALIPVHFTEIHLPSITQESAKLTQIDKSQVGKSGVPKSSSMRIEE